MFPKSQAGGEPPMSFTAGLFEDQEKAGVYEISCAMYGRRAT